MLQIFENLSELSRAAAQFICDASKKNISEKGNFSLVLSGGETPRTTYALLAEEFFKEQIEWNRVKLFFGDERCVPENDAKSNYRMVNEVLLQHVSIPRENIFPIPTNYTPEGDAMKYEETLKENFPTPFPEFDFIFLGLGENGHTASLFPYTNILNEKIRWVKEVYVEEQKSFRISLTAPAINSAKEKVFLVSGKNKAKTLSDVLKGEHIPEKFPVQLIEGNIIWMVDGEAGGLL